MMTTRSALASSSAASVGVALLTVRLSVDAVAVCDRAERAEQHVGDRSVHRLAHDERQHEARRAIERTRGDEQLVLEHEAHGDGRQAGVGVEERDHRRHVGAADRQDQQHAEDEREHDDDRERPGLRRDRW